jgi:phospholipase/carboxylesterase
MMRIKKPAIFILLAFILLAGCQSQSNSSAKTKTLKSQRILPLEYKGGKLPVLILLHGYGSNENDLTSLAHRFTPKFLVYAIQAPIQLRTDAYAWYHLQFESGHVSKFDTIGSLDAIKLLSNFIADLKDDESAKSSEVYLFGFSQGGMMSLEMAIRHPEQVTGVLSVCGMLAGDSLTYHAANPDLCQIPVFSMNGEFDTVVLPEQSGSIKNILGKCPDVFIKDYPCKHQITSDMLRDSDWFLRQLCNHHQSN